MRKPEIEQSIREVSYRLSKLNEKLQTLEGQYSQLAELEGQDARQLEEAIKNGIGQTGALEKRLSGLSDELYGYIARQDQQVIQHVDATGEDLARRVQCLSDEVYQHIGRQLKARDEMQEQYREGRRQEDWMSKFGYDSMIADLQLSQIESIVPGNRRRLVAFKNTHVGERCFVIGNGPSLKAADLDRLKQKQMFCFASKGIYKIFGQTGWRPDVWGVSDLDYIELKQDDVNQLQGFPKLVCAQSYLKKGILIRDAIYYPFIQAERTPRFFNADVERGVHFYGTITGKLINFAVYMGFTEIYLLGCDHTCPTKAGENGKKVVDASQQLHFSDSYYGSKEEQAEAYKNILDIEKSLRYMTDAYKDIQFACDRLGVRIYNATRGGELEVFPRVAFEGL